MHANRPSLAAITLPLLALSALPSSATAQIRVNLRSAMQIDGLSPIFNGTADERFWPIQVNAFAPGDVDGDGDLDLLAAVNGSSSRIWFNDGGGGFQSYVELPWWSGGNRCVLFDVEGDGDLDALIAGGRTAYAGSTAPSLFLNDGTGVFTASPTLPTTAIEAGGMAVGDIDGDGDRDVVISQPYGLVMLWRNMGNAVFVDISASVQPPIGGAKGVTLADIEPDGDLDIVFKTSALLASTRTNDGLGQFVLGPDISFEVPSVDTAVADVDGDGLPDRLGVADFAAPASDRPYVHRNLGNGQYQDASDLWFEPHVLVDRQPSFTWHACAVFDADGDGDPDFVTGGAEQRGATSTTVGVPPRLLLNIERQRFLDGGRPAFPLTCSGATAMDAGDIDGDGDVDLVMWAVNPYGAPASIWKQDAAGRFGEAGGLPFGLPYLPGLSALKLADVDGDQDLDVIGIAGWGMPFPAFPGQHRLLRNDGTGAFSDVTATHMPATANTGGASCETGDVDGDGDLDLVIGSYSMGWPSPGVPLQLLLNNGAGVFTDASTQLPATLFESGHLALRDFDGDGDLDLVVAADAYHTTSRPSLFFANDGTGVFTDQSATRLPVSMFAHGLSVLDLDNDGDLDIAQSDVNCVNDGTGHFTATAVPGLFPRIVVADFDQDGIPDDLLESQSGSNYGGLRFGNGPIAISDTNYVGHLVRPVDIDRDGDLDIVSATLPSGGSADQTYPRVEVIYNLRRDMRVVTHPRLGQPYRMQLRATNGTQPTVGLVLIAAATLTPPVAIPDWGHLVLDPLAIIPYTAVVIPDSDTAVEAVLPIPNQTAFHGLPLSCQSLLIPIGAEQHTHLTNAMTHTIER